MFVLQQQARDWWARERSKHVLVTSQLVLDEASLGDPAAAAERLKLLAGIPFYRALADLGYPKLLIYTPAEFLGSIDDDS